MELNKPATEITPTFWLTPKEYSIYVKYNDKMDRETIPMYSEEQIKLSYNSAINDCISLIEQHIDGSDVHDDVLNHHLLCTMNLLGTLLK